MIGVNLKAAKGMFFDAPKIMAAVDRATRSVLLKFGAFVRTSAKSSIRKRKRASRPGEPPTSRTGLLKRFIFFGYDTAQRSVTIGPVRLGDKTGEAPPALEYGGPTTIEGRVFRRRGGRNVREKQIRHVTIEGRPYMGPAFAKEQEKLPALWRDSVK